MSDDDVVILTSDEDGNLTETEEDALILSVLKAMGAVVRTTTLRGNRLELRLPTTDDPE